MTTRITSSSGYDVCFEDSAGNALAFDLDYYDSTAHSGAWWVQIPSLPSGSPTTIKMRYGDSSVTTNQSAPTTVWADYAAVYHLSELNGTSQLNSADGVRSTAGLGSSVSFQSSTKGTGRLLRCAYSGSANDKTQGIKTQATLTSSSYSVTMISNNTSGGSILFVYAFSPNYASTLEYENQVSLQTLNGNHTFRSGKEPLWGKTTLSYTGPDVFLHGASISDGSWRYTQIGSSITSGHKDEYTPWSNYTEFFSLISAWQGTFTYDVDELRLCKVAHSQAWMLYENANYINHTANVTYGPEMNSDGTRTIKLFPGMYRTSVLD